MQDFSTVPTSLDIGPFTDPHGTAQVHIGGAHVANVWTIGAACDLSALHLDAEPGEWDDLPTDAPGGDDEETGPYEIHASPLDLVDLDLARLHAERIAAAHRLGSGPALWFEEVAL